MRRGKYSYDGAFRPMEKQDLPMLAAGILLLAGGSLLLGAEIDQQQEQYREDHGGQQG